MASDNHGEETGKNLMRTNNPVFVPRNIHIEQALDLTEQGDLSMFNKLLRTLRQPYTFQENAKELLAFDENYDKQYQTFCGT